MSKQDAAYRGRKLMFMGALLVLIGVMIKYGYNASDMLLVVGGVLFVKGILLKMLKKP